MSGLTLPARPSLAQLKKQAKELLGRIRDHDANAVALFARHHPKLDLEVGRFALHDAQLVLARQYGFATWGRLKEEAELLVSDFSQRVARFVRDAVDADASRARRALSWEPDLSRADRWAALVTGEFTLIEKETRSDPRWVNRQGGPNGDWTPLLYVSFSCFQMRDADAKRRFADCARLLLDAGADPNAAWVHPYWENSPLKALYGATGVNDNPVLARLLLERGAEVDDGESIYHAAQFDHVECLEVLAEFGVSLGRHPRWRNTPLYFLLGMRPDQADWKTTARGIRWLLDQGSDPNIPCGEKGETALHAAVLHGHDREVIRRLLDAGADPNRADADGVVPLQLAQVAGRRDLVELLREHGAGEVELGEKERFFAAVFSRDREGAQAFLRTHPGFAETLPEDDRLTLNRAAEKGDLSAVRILLDCGFDIAFKGTKIWGSTPLHGAAWYGQAELVELLLSCDAPIDILANPPADSSPLGWAAHGSSNCGNPRGDYSRVVRALLAAGARSEAYQAEIASPEVAKILHAALAGENEEAKRSDE